MSKEQNTAENGFSDLRSVCVIMDELESLADDNAYEQYRKPKMSPFWGDACAEQRIEVANRASDIIAVIDQRQTLLEALEALTEWGCTHTSPRDENSPHGLLIAARAAIAKATGKEG